MAVASYLNLSESKLLNVNRTQLRTETLVERIHSPIIRMLYILNLFVKRATSFRAVKLWLPLLSKIYEHFYRIKMEISSFGNQSSGNKLHARI